MNSLPANAQPGVHVELHVVPGAGRGEETTHKFSAAGLSEVVDRGFTVQGVGDFVTEFFYSNHSNMATKVFTKTKVT